MTQNEIKVLRANIVCGMDTYIREVIGDDNITDYWLTEGLADGSTEEDILNDVEDEEIFEDYVACFKSCLYHNRQNK